MVLLVPKADDEVLGIMAAHLSMQRRDAEPLEEERSHHGHGHSKLDATHDRHQCPPQRKLLVLQPPSGG
jgi:hypothetical protein